MATIPAFPAHIDKNTDAFQRWLYEFYEYVKSLPSTDTNTGLGIGQSYTNPSNTLGTTYQNTTGNPIAVAVFTYHAGAGNSPLTAYCDSNSSPTTVVAQCVVDNGAAATPNLLFVVPNNYYYKVSFGDSDAGSGLTWSILS